MLQARSSHSVTAELNSEQFLGKASKGDDSKEETRLCAFFYSLPKNQGVINSLRLCRKIKDSPVAGMSRELLHWGNNGDNKME